MIDFFNNSSFRSGQHGRADCLAPLSARLKCLAQAHSKDKTGRCMGSQTFRSGTVAFKTLRCAIEVAYIFASVKVITIKFLVWENTTRKELQFLELASKVTTEFAYNGTSR